MSGETAKLCITAILEIYRNDKVTAWVKNSFGTDLERAAAWAMFGFLCGEYPKVQELIRGELVESTEEKI